MRKKYADDRAKILKEMALNESDLSFTQGVLVTQYEDCWREYRATKDGKIRREIMTAMRHLRKELGLNKGSNKKKKSLDDYKKKHTANGKEERSKEIAI